MNIPTREERAKWRQLAADTDFVSGLGEYTPPEFLVLLDAVDALESRLDEAEKNLAAKSEEVNAYRNIELRCPACGDDFGRYLPQAPIDANGFSSHSANECSTLHQGHCRKCGKLLEMVVADGFGTVRFRIAPEPRPSR